MRCTLPMLLTIAVTGCGPARGPALPGVSADPMVTSVLNERILSDPDLTSMSEDGAVLAMPDPFENMPPPFDHSDEEFHRARDAALQAVGGAFVTLAAPDNPGPGELARSPRDVAAALPSARPCLAAATTGAAWSASFPADLPIAPRGHLVAALGSDAPGCRLRAARYVVALSADDLAGFYAASAIRAGFSAARRKAGDVDVIEGAKGGASWFVHARQRPDGLAEVDLVTAD